MRFAQPQLCCVPDLGQAARSSSVCKPTRLTDARIPYATTANGLTSFETVNNKYSSGIEVARCYILLFMIEKRLSIYAQVLEWQKNIKFNRLWDIFVAMVWISYRQDVYAKI